MQGFFSLSPQAAVFAFAASCVDRGALLLAHETNVSRGTIHICGIYGFFGRPQKARPLVGNALGALDERPTADLTSFCVLRAASGRPYNTAAAETDNRNRDLYECSAGYQPANSTSWCASGGQIARATATQIGICMAVGGGVPDAPNVSFSDLCGPSRTPAPTAKARQI